MSKRTKTERNKHLLIHLLDKYSYSDRVDVSAEISLLKYGVVRNPKNYHTVFAHPAYDDDDASIHFETAFITTDWVMDVLETLGNDGFYSFVGSDKNSYIEKYITNDYLSSAIQDIISYWGHEDFGINFPFSYDIESIIDNLKDVNAHTHLK